MRISDVGSERGGRYHDMRILILGGTVFLGRALVSAAQERGHHVSILTRGLSGPDPQGVQAFRGDRDAADGLRALDGQTFDVVVDTSRQAVSHVRAATAQLLHRSGRYVFTSAGSVYRDFSGTGIRESWPTVDPMWPTDPAHERDRANYDRLNVACEQVVLGAMGDRGLIIRPGLIVGADDPSDRFGYWPGRIARGGEVLAPGRPEQQVQFIDVRDLAAFIVHAAEDGLSGIYNAYGPAQPITMGAFLRACLIETGSDARLQWVDDDLLIERGLRPFLDLPLWLPDLPENRGFSTVDFSKAAAAGLTHRPITDTIAAALATELRFGLERKRRAGLDARREAQLLADWRSTPHTPLARER